ncbi:MAG: CarD family transcriptional regulator [Clostridiales bacterium]|nr:CarD family transcriptional regulator [Clostridiales bacterium]
MFEIGDYIIYGNNGVCKVVDIGPIQLDNSKSSKLYYTLEPIFENGSKVYTPVGNKKVLMRPVISEEEAIDLIDSIPDIEYDSELTGKEREQKMKESLKSIDTEEWIKILKALYHTKEERLADGKSLTSSDEKYLKATQEWLYGELSVSLDKSIEEIEDYVLNRIIESELAN